jgi:hypothetical protein
MTQFIHVHHPEPEALRHHLAVRFPCGMGRSRQRPMISGKLTSFCDVTDIANPFQAKSPKLC